MLHGFCTISYQTRCSYICVCWPTLVLWSFDKKHASQFLCCAISVLCSSHVVDSNDGTITVAVMAGYTILNTFISKDPAFTCSNGSFLAVSAEDIIIIIFKQSFYTAVPRYYGSPCLPAISLESQPFSTLKLPHWYGVFFFGLRIEQDGAKWAGAIRFGLIVKNHGHSSGVQAPRM